MSHFDNIFQFLRRKNHTQTSTGALLKSCEAEKGLVFHTHSLSSQPPALQVGCTVTLRYDCPEFPCPKMVVKQITAEAVVCLWFTDPTRIEVAEFPKELLKVC